MQEVESYPHATFSWVDLATTNPDAAKKFYSGLMGWEAEDFPAGENMVYTMLRLHGRDVAALTGMPPFLEGTPPHWSSYICVDDLDAAAAKATELGGTIVMPPSDVMDAGRMAVVQDPTGAFFNLWQAGNHIGAKLVNIPGTLCWNELLSQDAETAAKYYSTLFDWEVQRETQQESGSDYIMFVNNGRFTGGLLQIQPEWGEMPSSWGVYFSVADCDAAAAKAVELGGKILNPPTNIPGTGRFALIQDPQGAIFAAIKLDQVDPPPSR
ncbi:MAG: VOC family protein [Anaerolineae bacterium]